MKQWFRLTLVCCVLLCLFLSLPRAVGLSHGLHIIGSRPWLDPGREPGSDASPVSLVRRMRFDLPRAAPLASLFLDGTWAASNSGPPGSEIHAPPKPIGPGELPVKESSRQLNQCLELNSSRNNWLNPPIFKESGFHNSL